MTLAIGTKVQVNHNYLANLRNIDETVTEVRGKEGIVTGYVGSFMEVSPTDTTNLFWRSPFLFWQEELDVLEEAHPLQKEFAKS
jgi:hypothetical protein